MYDTIIVGGGSSGLQLGALLSGVEGKKVLVLEKSSRLGGRANVLEKEGFIVDYGVHLIRFGPKSAISRTCRMLGHEVQYNALGTSWVFDIDGKAKVFPTSPKLFLSTRLISKKDLLTKGLPLILKTKRGDHSPYMETTVAAWLDEKGVSGGLRRYFHMVSASMQVCPFLEKSSAGEMLTNMQKVLKEGISVMYPRGGWKPLFQLWKDTIKRQGEIRTSTKVEKIALEDNHAVGVVADGELIKADKVVLSLPAFKLPELLPLGTEPPFVEMCRKTRPTAGIVLDYGLRERVSDMDGLFYLYDPVSFGMFTSNIDPSLAPPGRQLFTFLQPVREELFNDRKQLKEMEHILEQALFRVFPKMENAIQWRRALHLPVVDGAEVNVSQTRDKRPGFRVPGVRGLFLVGDSTAAPGAGGDIGHESVHLAYEEIKRSK